MDATTIDILAALDPKASVPKVTVASINYSASPLHEEARLQFLNNYCKVAFGWYIADQFAKAKKGFPIPMLGRDTWIFKAYLMQLDPWTNYNKHVANAYHLALPIKGVPDMGSKLKALILSTEDDDPVIHMRKVARISGLPYETVEAFESLFYNVLDRRSDGLYISSEVYPMSRIVELAESYMADSTIGDLLKRAGYNHGDLDMTAYMIGIGDRGYMAKLAASENRESELSMHIMGNGLIFAKANLLNHRSVGMSRASALMVASRQSGAAMEEPTLSGVASLFSEEFKRATSLSQKDTAQRMRVDAGVTIEV